MPPKTKKTKKCGGCALAIGAKWAIQCNKCHQFYHCAPKCCDVKATEAQERAPTFICVKCIESFDVDKSVNIGASTSSDGSVPTEKVLDSNSKIKETMKSLNESPRDIAKLVEAIGFLSDKFDEILKLFSRIEKLEREMKSLTTKSGRSSRMQNSYNAYHNDVIISKVPEIVEEDIGKVARIIMSGLGTDIKESEILEVSRFGSKDAAHKVFLKVRFANPMAKRKAIKASREKKATFAEIVREHKNKPNQRLDVTLTGSAGGITFKGDDMSVKENKIYINESVSKSAYAILKKALALKKEKTVHSVWTLNNKVYYKKTAEDSPRILATLEDVDKLESAM